MLGKFVSRLRRLPWDKLAGRVGSFAASCRPGFKPVVFAASFAFVVVLVHREVYSFIAQRPRFTVPSIRTAVAPAWANRQGVETVRVDTLGATLFDRDLVERVGRSYESCPWVRKVTSVERVFPDEVRVKFEYRRPHVAFRRSNGYVVVDAEGVRLPGVYVDPPPCDRTVEVAGAVTLPPEPGRVWNDPAVRAGLEMAEFVHKTAFLKRLEVREVDLSNLGGRIDPRRSEVALVTSNGCAIYWGRLSSNPRFGDPSPAEKIENLREVMAVYPGLGGLRGVKVCFRGSRAVEPHEAWAKKPR
jgi:hypothetical protein